MSEEYKKDDTFLIIIGAFILVCLVLEATMISIAFIMADEVNCNWLWCDFSTTKQSQIIKQDCFENGIRINCSDFSGDEHFCNNGLCEINGVMSPEEYFKQLDEEKE